MNVRVYSAALLLLPCFVVRGSAADSPKPAGKKITVNGSATVAVKPDGARLVFSVNTTMADVRSVRAENDKQVKKMRESLAVLGFKSVDIRTTPGSVTSTQTGDPTAPAGPVNSKQVQTAFTVTVREKDAVKLHAMVTKLSDTAVENGGVGTDDYSMMFGLGGGRMRGRGLAESSQGPQIEWLNLEVAEARREAIKKAVRDAQASAQAAAPDAKLEIVEITVSNGDVGMRQRLRGGPYGYVQDNSPNSVTVEVQVTFRY